MAGFLILFGRQHQYGQVFILWVGNFQLTHHLETINFWHLNIQEYKVEEEWTSGPVSVVPYRAEHHAGEGPALALRITCGGKTVTYSGDGSWGDGLAAAARGADLFIAECYFFDKKVNFHMNLETLAEHIGDVAPKRLILTHMSEDMLERVEGLDYETAEDGKVVEI